MTFHRPFLIILTLFTLLFIASSPTMAAKIDLPGEYRVMEQEPSLHQPGKVILIEFADFYCPHCHMFETVVVSKLKKEFGNKLEVRMVGFPVIRGKLPTAFEMYEQAQKMGKGPEMKRVLFRTIHKDNIHIFDKSLRALLIGEVGLNIKEFEDGMGSGEPYQALEKGRAWGDRIGVTHTPTVVLDGNIRIDNLDTENLKTVVKGILKTDEKS